MSELEDKLGGIFNSPEKMAQIMQLAQSFSAAEKPQETQSTETGAAQIDPRIMRTITSLMTEFSSPGKSTALLSAVQPYLRQERREKVEKAIKIARVAKLAGKALGEMGGSGLV